MNSEIKAKTSAWNGAWRFVLLAFWLASSLVFAEQKISKHGLDVHYVAFNSSFLDADIAFKHGLKRGSDIGVLNIAVRTQSAADSKDGQKSRPLAAELEGNIFNLLSQKRRLNFHEIRSGDAIYYVANFKFTADERLTFDVDVLAEKKPIKVRFRQQFYVDDL